MPRVTISDIARAAGVSQTAVSFAFNSPSRLSPATVSRILAVANELGYAPNPLSRGLVAGRTGMLGVVVPQSLDTIYANPFFATLFRGIGSICDEHNLGLLTLSPHNHSLEQSIARAPVDGFIIVGLNEQHHEVMPLRKRSIPFVIVDGDAETAPSVNSEDEISAYASAAHLLKQGHREVMILAFETPERHLDNIFYGVGARRTWGYQRAFAEYDLAWPGGAFLPTIGSIEGGARRFAAAWDDGHRPTAVLAASDVIALGVLQAARQRGLHIPGDLEVIGYDDIPLAALACPALSTVHQPIVEKGRRAAELLVAALNGDRGAEQLMLESQLILRETTR
ncbi:MAG TPA: LacI family DNA-binding transcriptional regulator [Herpetosiphonaceae bacterium]